jgi:glycosidase
MLRNGFYARYLLKIISIEIIKAFCGKLSFMSAYNFPSLYQINTRVWLTELFPNPSHPATLNDIPAGELDKLASMGFDLIWLLSVWQTGDAGRKISREEPGLLKEFQETLPDLTEDDIQGSGFAITAYRVSTQLGGEAALAGIREKLADRGMKLILDFVPNHVAIDHEWVDQFPAYFIHGTESQLLNEPGNYIRVKTGTGELILAHGRDPFFTGWTDTLQLNYGNPELQEAMIGELVRIAGQCDGVRCDMSMLLLPEVFEKTWGIAARPFWPEAIKRVRAVNPGFLFMAEVYWDLEWTLQQQGFDFTYDKRLYDRLLEGNSIPVREHFRADLDYQARSVRFLENHDEKRVAVQFPGDMHEAAAILTFLSTGLRFFHQGELEGKKKKISPHLTRGPVEPVNEEIKTFYGKLLSILQKPVLRNGSWSLAEARQAWDNNPTNDCYICFAWELDGEKILVVVNYASNNSQCYVQLPFKNMEGKPWQLRDLFTDTVWERSGDELQSKGLYLDEAPWRYYVFSVE